MKFKRPMRAHATRLGRARHKNSNTVRKVMESTPDRAAMQLATPLEASPISPEQEIQTWKRKHLIAHQVIGILSAEIRELKIALERRAAA
jgi:hypothetical protein